jgi:hypothetical protein
VSISTEFCLTYNDHAVRLTFFVLLCCINYHSFCDNAFQVAQAQAVTLILYALVLKYGLDTKYFVVRHGISQCNQANPEIIPQTAYEDSPAYYFQFILRQQTYSCTMQNIWNINRFYSNTIIIYAVPSVSYSIKNFRFH